MSDLLKEYLEVSAPLKSEDAPTTSEKKQFRRLWDMEDKKHSKRILNFRASRSTYNHGFLQYSPKESATTINETKEESINKVSVIFDGCKLVHKRPSLSKQKSLTHDLYNRVEKEAYKARIERAKRQLDSILLNDAVFQETPVKIRPLYPIKHTFQFTTDFNKSNRHEEHMDWFDKLLERAKQDHDSIMRDLPKLSLGHPLKKDLLPAQLEAYRKAMAGGNENEVLSSSGAGKVLRKDIHTLAPGRWLNDEVINYYLKLLRQHCLGSTQDDPVYFHSTYFLPKLLDNNNRTYTYKNVARWTKRGKNKCDLFSQRLIGIPVNLSNTHWTLVAVLVREKKILYLDSMGSSGAKHLKIVLRYLCDEMLDKKQQTLDTTAWELVDLKKNVPQQQNGFDCGMFLLIYCLFLTMKHDIDFSQADMTYFRKRVCVDILANCLDVGESVE